MRKLFRIAKLFQTAQSSRTIVNNCKNFFLIFGQIKAQALVDHLRNAPIQTQHRQFVPLYDLQPSVGPLSFVAPNATLVGEVSVGHDCAIWYNAVLRGDLNSISLHSFVTVGERSVIHTAASLPTGLPASVEIGMFVVIQSNCTLYSCTVGNEVLIGHRSIIMEGSILEDGCAIGPNSVVPPGRIIPANQLWAGNPVQYIRDLEKNEVFQFNTLTKLNSEVASHHNYEFLQYNSAYLQQSHEEKEDDIDPKEFTGVTDISDEDYRKNV